MYTCRIPKIALFVCLFDDFDDYKVKSIIEGKYNGIDAKIEDIILKNKVYTKFK